MHNIPKMEVHHWGEKKSSNMKEKHVFIHTLYIILTQKYLAGNTTAVHAGTCIAMPS